MSTCTFSQSSGLMIASWQPSSIIPAPILQPVQIPLWILLLQQLYAIFYTYPFHQISVRHSVVHSDFAYYTSISCDSNSLSNSLFK